MRSVRTPHVAVGYTTSELTIRWRPSSMSREMEPYSHVVPAGTRCHALQGGTAVHWVVADLSWLPRKEYSHFDADHYGIPVDAKDIGPEPLPAASPGMR